MNLKVDITRCCERWDRQSFFLSFPLSRSLGKNLDFELRLTPTRGNQRSCEKKKWKVHRVRAAVEARSTFTMGQIARLPSLSISNRPFSREGRASEGKCIVRPEGARRAKTDCTLYRVEYRRVIRWRTLALARDTGKNIRRSPRLKLFACIISETLASVGERNKTSDPLLRSSYFANA